MSTIETGLESTLCLSCFCAGGGGGGVGGGEGGRDGQFPKTTAEKNRAGEPREKSSPCSLLSSS